MKFLATILLFSILSLANCRMMMRIDDMEEFRTEIYNPITIGPITSRPTTVAQKHCCFYDGKPYYLGQKIYGICFELTCSYRGWTSSNVIDSKCATCFAWQDPNLRTFDSSSQFYVWHGKCNYTMVEPTTFSPSLVARYPTVHSNFEKCTPTSTSTCLDVTTFKVNANTVVEIDHLALPNIKVNNVPVSVSSVIPTQVSLFGGLAPVIAWRQTSFSTCINLQGADFSLYACKRSLKVYLPTSYKGKVGGLCGFYNGVESDDHREKDGTIQSMVTHPFDFPVSWLSSEQPRAICKDPREYSPEKPVNNNGGIDILEGPANPGMFRRPSSSAAKQSLCPEENTFRERCRNTVGTSSMLSIQEVNMLIESCVEELCNDPGNAEFWLTNAQEIALDEEELAMRTVDESLMLQ